MEREKGNEIVSQNSMNNSGRRQRVSQVWFFVELSAAVIYI